MAFTAERRTTDVESLKSSDGGAWKGTALPRTSEELSKMRSEHQVISWFDGKAYRYPKWQFDRSSGGFLPGIQEVIQTMVRFWGGKGDGGRYAIQTTAIQTA
jgi:hypothetical protein